MNVNAKGQRLFIGVRWWSVFTPLPADPGSACQSWHADIVATSHLITILIQPSQSPNDTAAGRLISEFDLASVHSS